VPNGTLLHCASCSLFKLVDSSGNTDGLLFCGKTTSNSDFVSQPLNHVIASFELLKKKLYDFIMIINSIEKAYILDIETKPETGVEMFKR